ncbi:uncharacterized protein V6R79_025229 [Siganus canaliculatus]
MEQVEHSRYISQLKAEFDSCDTTATGFLDQEELTALCRKLQLDAQLPLLLDALLGGRSYARVTFEEFKDAFVDVLSRSLDFSTSEDDSSYLEPAVPEEVKPKFVKGTKRYGRRSRPDSKPDAPLTRDSEDSMPSRAEATDSSPAGVRKAKLRRSTSLESVESLKSDEETGSHKDHGAIPFQNKGAAEEAGLGTGGGVLTAACDHLVRHRTPPAAGRSHDLWTYDRPVPLRQNLDLDPRISIRDLHRVLRGSAPFSCSTPTRSADLQSQVALEERSLRSTSPSLLTATVGPRVLSLLDDGSGFCSPEKVIALWTEEGIRNSRDILQTLDFSLEDRLSLVDLTLALDNELLVGGSGIHQAALISYKNEIQHLQAVAEQASSERDKVKADLDLADHRNLQLVREVDDRHASMETLNQSRIRDLEQDYRDRLTALRSEAEQESEAELQQVERERDTLLDELQLLQAKEAELQEELCSTSEENRRLEEELGAVKLKLDEAQVSVSRLQTDLDQLLLDKFGSLDPAAAAPSPEERFSELVQDFELQCRELRDRNDELSSELDLLKSQKSVRKSRRRVADDGVAALSWTQHQADSDTDESPVRKKLQPADKSALCSLDVSGPDVSSPAFSGPDVSGPAFSGPDVSGPAFSGPDVSGPAFSGPTVSIQTELALEQLKQKHEQELQQLHVQLETQVNYYERSLEVMRQSMEVERKDISQAFKLEISELEEQKAEAEQQVKQLTEALEKLQAQLQRGGGGGGGGWSTEQERRMHWERAELEQNFAREISNLVQRLSAEKEQLEAELQLKMDQEVALVREEAEQHLLQLHLQEAQRQQEAQQQEEAQQQQEAQRQQEAQQQQEALAELRGRCAQLEQHLQASGARCSELEAQLEENVCVLEAQEEKTSVEEQLLDQVSQLKEELLQEQQEVHALKTDRDKLIQDLKDQAMAVDSLRLELDRKRTCEELQEALRHVQTRLEEEQEEVRLLGQESGRYSRLVDQLSTQIVEMEEEISTLREQLGQLSSQLNGTADLVLDLRRQLKSRSSQVDRLQVQLQVEQQDFEEEKRRMREQLMELEKLVLSLEEVSEPSGPCRTQLDQVRSENGALQQRLGLLDQQVQGLEDEVAKKRRRLEELDRDHERSREEEERLHRENSRYREEVLDLSNRNLQLSNHNAELSARLRGDQESIGMLRERLATVSKEQEEESASVRRLQDEMLQQQMVWTQEKQLLLKEVQTCKDKLSRLTDLEEELSSTSLKLQRAEDDKKEVQGEAQDHRDKVEKLELEAELLRSQLQAVSQDKLGHAQEVTSLERKLQVAQTTVEELETSVRRLVQEQEEQEEQVSMVWQEETCRLRLQNQELQQELQELQVHSEEQQLEEAQRRSQLTQAQDQAARSEAALSLLQAQHVRRLQELQEQTGGACREQLEEAQRRSQQLEEAQRRSQQLEEELRLQLQKSSSQISLKQEQFQKTVEELQQRVQELEVKLKAARLLLQEKVQELKRQLVQSAQSGALLQELYVENAQLMAALQVTERRQKSAEKSNFLLEGKVAALKKLLKEVVMATLAS